MATFPTENYAPVGALAQAANIGMTPLNALFSGMQTRDVQQMRQRALEEAQQRILQQKLESERYGQMTPLELQIKGMESARAREMSTPEMLEAYTGGYKGQMQSQKAAGEIAEATLPYKKEAGALEQQNLLEAFKLRKYLSDMDRVINAGYDERTGIELNPQQVEALKQQRDELALRIASTPEQMGKEELALLKGQSGAGATRNLLSGIRLKMGTDVPLTEEEANVLGDSSLAGKPLQKPMASTDVARAQRMLQGANAAIARMDTIMKFKEGADVGMMPNLSTKDGLPNAIRNFAGKTVMPSEAKMMNTIFQGLGRDLAAVEAGGLATGLTELAKKLESGVYINPGEDDAATVAMKLADVHQVIVEHLSPSIGVTLRGEQGKAAQQIVDRVKKVIPYTPDDVIEAYNKATGGGKTIGQRSTELVGQSAKKITSDAEYNELPSGTIFVGPDGVRRRKP